MGLVVWPIVGIFSYVCTELVIESLQLPRDVSSGINLCMYAVQVSELFSVPVSIYLLSQHTMDIIVRKDLKRPRHIILLLIIIFSNITSKTIWIVFNYSEKANRLATEEKVFWLTKEIVHAIFVTLILTALQIFVFGVVIANFIQDCKGLKEEAEAGSSVKQLLDRVTHLIKAFDRLQSGAQFGLFSQFTGHTITIILLGYLATVSSACLNLRPLDILQYVFVIFIFALTLCYLGIIMDECYQEFQVIYSIILARNT